MKIGYLHPLKYLSHKCPLGVSVNAIVHLDGFVNGGGDAAVRVGGGLRITWLSKLLCEILLPAEIILHSRVPC